MTDSLWISEADLPVWEPLAPSTRCEVLVVGAGLAGCGAALALQARGVDVQVVDALGPGRGASGRNAGFVLLAHLFELPALQRACGAESVGPLLSIARRTHAALRERFGEAGAHAPCGSSMLSVDGDDAEAQALEDAARLLTEHGVEAHFEPVQSELRGFARRLRVHEDGAVHPGRLLAAMAAGIERGARAEITALGGGRARTKGGAEVRFERALVATNAAAAALVPALRGVITPHRAQMLATAPVEPHALDDVVYAGWGYDYFRQRADGSVLLGGRRQRFLEAEATDVAEPSAEVQAALEAYLAAHLPFAARAPVVARWAGIMGFSPDGLPVCGAAPGLDGVDVLAGFTGHGLGLAVGLAEGWAREEPSLAMFAPERFADANV